MDPARRSEIFLSQAFSRRLLSFRTAHLCKESYLRTCDPRWTHGVNPGTRAERPNARRLPTRSNDWPGKERMGVSRGADAQFRSVARERKPFGHELTHTIIGGFFEVYNHLGYGLLETGYAAALRREFESRGLHVDREVWVTCFTKGSLLPNSASTWSSTTVSS